MKMLDLGSFTKDYFHSLTQIIDQLDQRKLVNLVKIFLEAYKNRRTIFFCGNGGSSSLASHMAADIGKNTLPPSSSAARFKTISLVDNPSWITAVGNDLSFDDIFVEQLRNLSSPGDLLVVISGSGNSKNIIKVLKWAASHKLVTVGLLGFDGGQATKLVDLAITVPVHHYGFVEGIHAEIAHYLVAALRSITEK